MFQVNKLVMDLYIKIYYMFQLFEIKSGIFLNKYIMCSIHFENISKVTVIEVDSWSKMSIFLEYVQ